MGTYDDYESGPFCRHWSDPYECERACAHCVHKCCQHDQREKGHCDVKGCSCPGFEDRE